MKDHSDDTEVVYLVRDDSSLTYLFVGAAIGAAVALLFAPSSGVETRRSLKRRAGQLKALAEERVDDIEDRVSEGTAKLKTRVRGAVDEARTSASEVGDAIKSVGTSARDELEKRLADSRARRRGSAVREADEEEEPVA